MRLKRQLMGAFALLPLFAIGCGSNAFDSLADKSSDAAKKEAAQIAIDKGSYDEAIAILLASCPSNTCPDSKTAQQLAAAYMGKAGLNVLDLAKYADQASDTGTSDFTTITKALSYSSTSAANIQNAATILNNTINNTAYMSTLTVDQRSDLYMQQGIANATAAIITVGSASSTSPGFGSTGLPNACTGTGSNPCSSFTISTTDADTVANSLVNATTAFANLATVNSANNSNNSASQAVNDLANNIASIGASGTTCNTSSNSTSSASTTTSSTISTGIQNYVRTCVN